MNWTTIKQNACSWLKGFVIGGLAACGIFNVIFGCFISPNSWQVSCGSMQILLAIAIWD